MTGRHGSVAREIAIVLIVKLLALVLIRLVWFSDPPAVGEAETARRLDAPVSGQTQEEPA